MYDLTGQTFGRWTVLNFVEHKYSPNGTSLYYWRCRCQCGRIVNVLGGSLRNGLSKSCGCLRTEIIRQAHGVNAFHVVIKTYRYGAKSRNYPWELTDDEAMSLFKGNCHYCGAEPRQIKRVARANGTFIYNGIDRVDNTKGYTFDNCVSCCKRCNRAKDQMSYDEFKVWANQLSKWAKTSRT